MTRVLFVTYHFPPVGGAGVQRSVKFVRYLPELGYEPVVLTGPGPASDRWTPTDQSLGAEVPASTEVLRVPGPVPERSTGMRARGERWLRLRTGFARWWQQGIASLGQEAGDVDLVYVSMSPFESAPAVADLARDLGRPWIADLRDPWAVDEMIVHPTAVHRRLELARMERLLASAAAVVVNTSEAKRALVGTLSRIDPDKVFAIPNGYDASDFTGTSPPRGDGVFRIVHAGYLHTELGLAQQRTGRLRRIFGGDEGQVDHLARSHVFLLRALDRLLDARPQLAGSIELHLAGVLSPADRAAIDAELRRPEMVKTPGYLTHAETIALLRSADLLFLPMHGLPPGRRARIVPGKTYEYLAAQRPILAAVPDGDARDLLERAGALLCRPADVDGLTEALSRQLDQAASAEDSVAGPGDFLKRFERRNLARELADVFDEAISRGASRHAARESAGAPS
ncbi:MAG: glycosyltransferase family 4 protein [Candidatus Limnocylindria bacterium]